MLLVIELPLIIRIVMTLRHVITLPVISHVSTLRVLVALTSWLATMMKILPRAMVLVFLQLVYANNAAGGVVLIR